MNCFILHRQAAFCPHIIRNYRNESNKRLIAAQGLKENVASLPSIESIKAVTLQPINHTIPNAPGKKASVAIYSHLASKYGGKLTAEAAEEGLQLYDEVVAEAKAQPGSHPNIDILLDVISNQTTLIIQTTEQ